MTSIFRRWFQRNFSSPATIVLSMLLLVGFVFILTLGDILAPILWALVIAYLLEWLVAALEKRGMKRFWAVLLVFVGFVTTALLIILGLVPLIWQQGSKLVTELPSIGLKAKNAVLALPEKYPNMVSTEQVNHILNSISSELGSLGQGLVSASFSSLMGVASVLIYIVLVPLLVFFFMKDRNLIFNWFGQWLPAERQLAESVWSEVNRQIGNYIRGKVMEIIIVGSASYLAFVIMGLNYALLLGVLVGFSVLIPYIGAALVTIPVVLIGFFQWGFSQPFYVLFVVYMVIQILDGNVLVPLLFSEAVSLHPVAIIGAILLFGGLWGFWGVFFAIPLAILVNAVLDAVKDHRVGQEEAAEVAEVGAE